MSSAPLILGIDFDNTIAGYDKVFTNAARDNGWISGGDAVWSKRSVRDAVRLLDDGEIKWQLLQAQAYGRRMAEAEMIDGFREFMAVCGRNAADICIVSHKTIVSPMDPNGINLRDAARNWIADQRIGVHPSRIFFESTREEKIARIATLGCSHFIDDLEEVFQAPDFPKGVTRILLSSEPHAIDGVRVCASWRDICHAVFD